MLDTISSILREDARYGIEHEEMLDTISSILREDAWYGIEHTQMLGHCIETYDGCVFKKKTIFKTLVCKLLNIVMDPFLWTVFQDMHSVACHVDTISIVQ